MKRLFAITLPALLLGLTPALAQTQDPAMPTQQEPSMQAPQSSETPSAPSMKIPETTPDMTTPGQSSEAAKPISPNQSAQFINEQKSDDWLASQLIGKAAVNAQNETIGDVNDLVTDRDGKIVAALIGVGGFLGIGEKDVAVRFEDLKLTRDENNDTKVVLDISKDLLASAPDYRTLDEQPVVEGAAKSDRDDTSTY